jgi:hypothetical protein
MPKERQTEMLTEKPTGIQKQKAMRTDWQRG